MRQFLAITACAGLLAGCANLAPDYVRPEAPVAATLSVSDAPAASFSMPAWQEWITDTRLKQVIGLALSNNRNLRSTALNVEKVRATYRIAGAALYPTLTGSAGSTTSESSDKISHKYSIGLAVGYELDFFNRIGNLKDAALESYLASEASQRSTQISLIASVANEWLTLAADQSLLQLAQTTLESRQQTLALYRKQRELGAISDVTLTQQSALVESARLSVASYKSQLAQDRNALNLLAGTAVPSALLPVDGTTLESGVSQLVDIPAGLPSSALLQRPDIMAAEHTLKMAYANIGAARAAFFPSVSLTASGGSSSAALGDLFKSGSEVWTFAPQITVPIFNAGSLQASLDSARLTRDANVAAYEYTLQTAFREVSDVLAERSQIDERLDASAQLVAQYRLVADLTAKQYEKGYSSYLAVLDAQRTLYSAQQSQISLRLTEQLNRIAFFKVLGGGSLQNPS